MKAIWIAPLLVSAVAFAQSTPPANKGAAAPTASKGDPHRADDVARHRQMAKAHEEAARCLEGARPRHNVILSCVLRAKASRSVSIAACGMLIEMGRRTMNRLHQAAPALAVLLAFFVAPAAAQLPVRYSRPCNCRSIRNCAQSARISGVSRGKCWVKSNVAGGAAFSSRVFRRRS